MNRSESIHELAAALSKAQAAMSPAEKDGTNPHFKSRFATLSSVWDACRGPLTDNGLSVVQAPVLDDGGVVLATTLLHSSGQWVESRLPLPGGPPNPQALGSAITYMRRYALAALVGVVAEDDDGEMAAANAPQAPQRRPDLRRIEPMPEPKIEDSDAEFRRYVDRAIANWEKFEPFGPTESRRAREMRLSNHMITEAIEAGHVAEAATWKPGTRSRSPSATWDALQYLHREHRTWLLAGTLKYLREKSTAAKAEEKADENKYGAEKEQPAAVDGTPSIEHVEI